MTRIFSVIVLSFALCSGFVCTGSQVHNLRVANADLAAALNHTAAEIVSLDSQGVITPAEEQAALLKINEATLFSDGVVRCLDNYQAVPSVAPCIRPLLQGIETDLNSLGIKSAGAQAAVESAVKGVLLIFDEFSAQGVPK